jgi:type IV secretion system protein VirD4
VETQQQSRSSSADIMRTGGSNTEGTSLAHHGRPLLMPDEIRRMGEDNVLVLEQGQPPYRLQRLDYLHDSEFVGLADPNPMYASVQKPVVVKRPGDPVAQ